MQSQVQPPHPHEDEGAPGSRARPLPHVPCPGWAGPEGGTRTRRGSPGRGQAVPGWQDHDSVLLLSWLHPLEQAGCWGLCALPRDAGGSHRQCPPCPEATRRVSLAVPARAHCQHSLTRVSVRPEPLPGALPSSLCTLWVTSAAHSPRLGMAPSQPWPLRGSPVGAATVAESHPLRGLGLSLGTSPALSPGLSTIPSRGMSLAPSSCSPLPAPSRSTPQHRGYQGSPQAPSCPTRGGCLTPHDPPSPGSLSSPPLLSPNHCPTRPRGWGQGCSCRGRGGCTMGGGRGGQAGCQEPPGPCFMPE